MNDWADSISQHTFKEYEHERGQFTPSDKKELIRRYADVIRQAAEGTPTKSIRVRTNLVLKLKNWWNKLLT